jgi:predicted O-methyltransferase YrrM
VDFVAHEVEAYAEAHTTPMAEWMKVLADETRASLDCPQMLTGPVEARFLEMIVWASSARRVLELGTYSGYSSLAMAAALPEGGRITTCELSEEHAAFAQRHIDASPYAERIEIRVGPALETVTGLEGLFDLIFVDAHKPEYPAYYEAVLPLLAPRGLIVFDNTLWSGRVVEGKDDGSESTRALKELNDRLASDPRVVAVQLTVRDGITLVRHADGP